MYSLDVLDLIKRKFWFILFFVILSVALALLYFFKAPKTFESWSRLSVEERGALTLNNSDDTIASEKPVEKYLEYLNSERILNPAIDSGKFDDLETFEESSNILVDLKENLTVRGADAKGMSGAIHLSYKNGVPEETKAILDAIVISFESYIESDKKMVGGEVVETLDKIKGELSTRLTRVEKEIQELSAKPELLLKDGNVQSTFAIKHAKLTDELYERSRERTRMETQVEDIRLQRHNGADQDMLIISLLQEMNEQSLGGYVTTHQKYIQLKIDELELLNELGADHPKMMAIRKQIEMVEQLRMEELAALRGGQPGSGIGTAANSRPLVDIFIDEMESRIRLLKSEEHNITKEVEQQQEQAVKFAAEVEKLAALQRERERLEQVYYAELDRLNEFNALDDYDWRTLEVLDKPTVAEQVAPNLKFALGGGLILGCLMGLLFAALKETAEKTFRSSEDVSEMLGSRVIGHVGRFGRSPSVKKSDFPGIAAEVVTLHQPGSTYTEAYRGIRTSMFFAARESGAKVIQISSPTPGDGKSTTAVNLAVSMAQSGRKVVLVDADLRKPAQHQLLGLDNERGVTSLLCGESTVDEVLHEIQTDKFYAIACGPIPGNPSELLTAGQFARTLAELRKRFDFVIIDTPPLLAVTDPAIVSSHVDLVYLVMRIRNGVRSNAKRAKDILDSVGVQLGGVIVNGLRRKDQKTYEYGGGRYGYGGYGGYGRRSYGQSASHEAMNVSDTRENRTDKGDTNGVAAKHGNNNGSAPVDTKRRSS